MTFEIFGNTVEKNEFFLFLTEEKKKNQLESNIAMAFEERKYGTNQVTETRTAQLYRYFSEKKKKRRTDPSYRRTAIRHLIDYSVRSNNLSACSSPSSTSPPPRRSSRVARRRASAWQVSACLPFPFPFPSMIGIESKASSSSTSPTASWEAGRRPRPNPRSDTHEATTTPRRRRRRRQRPLPLSALWRVSCFSHRRLTPWGVDDIPTCLHLGLMTPCVCSWIGCRHSVVLCCAITCCYTLGCESVVPVNLVK